MPKKNRRRRAQQKGSRPTRDRKAARSSTTVVAPAATATASTAGPATTASAGTKPAHAARLRRSEDGVPVGGRASVATVSAVQPDTRTAPVERPVERRRPARGGLAIALLALVVALAGIAAALFLYGREGSSNAEPTPTPAVVIGIPGGGVIGTESPTVAPTPVPTPVTTPSPVSTPPPVATAAPVAVASPTPVQSVAPAEHGASPPANAAPVAAPADAVVAFYQRVTDGDFDAAHSLWSDRMRATYPRAENLDERFAGTASITFDQLYVAEQSATTATVQANFLEAYDSGGSRRFIGYWRLIRTDDGWLLDEPHY